MGEKAQKKRNWSALLKDCPELPDRYAFRVYRAFQECGKPIDGLSYEIPQLTWIFTQVMQSLYCEIYQDNPQRCLRGKDLLVCGHVVAGFGDYYQMLATADMLHRRFCSKIKILALTDNLETRKDQFILPDPTKFDLVFHDPEEDPFADREPFVKMASDAAIIVETPQLYFCDYTIGFKDGHTATKVKFHEYDWVKDRPRYTPSSRSMYWDQLTMGLGPFTLGIVIKEPERVGGIASLESGTLKGILFSTTTPSSQDEAHYLNSHKLVYAYFQMTFEMYNFKGSPGSVTMQEFIFSSCFSLVNDDRAIDCICPVKRILNANWNIPDKEHVDFDLALFQKAGIGRIQLYAKKEKGALALVEEVALGAGKVLRIINPFPISNSDVQILTKASYNVVGCTGNLSLTEAISYEKTPRYQPMPHTQRVLHHLKELATDYVGGSKADELPKLLGLYTPGSRASDPFAAGKLIADPKTAAQTKELSLFIKTYCNFNEVLIDTIYRAVAHKEYKQLQEQEAALLNDFLKRKKTLVQCYDLLKRAILNVVETEVEALQLNERSFNQPGFGIL